MKENLFNYLSTLWSGGKYSQFFRDAPSLFQNTRTQFFFSKQERMRAAPIKSSEEPSPKLFSEEYVTRVRRCGKNTVSTKRSSYKIYFSFLFPTVPVASCVHVFLSDSVCAQIWFAKGVRRTKFYCTQKAHLPVIARERKNRTFKSLTPVVQLYGKLPRTGAENVLGAAAGVKIFTL